MNSDREGEPSSGAGDRAWRSKDSTSGGGNEYTTLRRSLSNDPQCPTVWGGGARFEDAVCQCSHIGSPGSPHGPSDSQRHRPEISRLPGHFRVGSNSDDRLDCATPDGHTTQAGQLPRQTIEDALSLQPPQGHSLGADLATRPRGQNDRAGIPTSVYTPPESGLWGP